MIALSFSRLSDYLQCPKKFKAKYIDKDYPDDSDNPHFIKGNEIHSQLEGYVKSLRQEGDAPIIGSHVKSVIPWIEKIFQACNGNMHPELQLAVDQNWKACDWFAKPTVVKYRAIIDAIAFFDDHLVIIDWKTGKLRPYNDYPESQLNLTACILFNLYPNINTITSCYVYVEHKHVEKKTFKRENLEFLMAPFDKAYKIVNEDKEFKFKKNQYCRWCLVTNCPVKNP